jgi:N-formylglutamate amidohydrolase
VNYFTTIRIKNLPIICNIPHSSIKIPLQYRPDFVILNKDLCQEAKRLADLYTDEFYSGVLEESGGIISRLSRLVVDMERLEDDAKEDMSIKGMGAIYTKTEAGNTLKRMNRGKRRQYTEELYHPYHAALTKMVDACLRKFGTCLILDCHSFPSVPRRYEPDQNKNRPDICIGTDTYHTPDALRKTLSQNLRKAGYSVKFNSPFSGTLVPLNYYQVNNKVHSILLEVNRKLYMNEDIFTKKDDFDHASRKINYIIMESCRSFLDPMALG